jgi:hypothetical protein
MGMDLALLPAYNQKDDFSHDLLTFFRDYDLFDKIVEKSRQFGIPVKEGGISSFYSRNANYEGAHYGSTEETPYGERLKYVTANHLKDAVKDFKTDSWRNKAIFAFINELPDDLQVYLYWH